MDSKFKTSVVVVVQCCCCCCFLLFAFCFLLFVSIIVNQSILLFIYLFIYLLVAVVPYSCVTHTHTHTHTLWCSKSLFYNHFMSTYLYLIPSIPTSESWIYFLVKAIVCPWLEFLQSGALFQPLSPLSHPPSRHARHNSLP